jgi:hypothetical protein
VRGDDLQLAPPSFFTPSTGARRPWVDGHPV